MLLSERLLKCHRCDLRRNQFCTRKGMKVTRAAHVEETCIGWGDSEPTHGSGSYERKYPARPAKQQKYSVGTPLCDVVLPYHTGALPYVEEAVRSILNQTLNQGQNQVVLHLIADGILPEDDPVVGQFDYLPNVRTYYSKEAAGPYVACLQVFQHLESDYLAIMDGDDIALPHRLEYSIRKLKETNADIFGGCMLQFVDYRNQDTAVLDRWNEIPIHRSVKRKDGYTVVNCTMVIRRQVFEELNGFRDFFCGADIHFIKRAFDAGYRFHCAEEIVGLRRLMSSSISNNRHTGIGTDLRKEIHAQQQSDFQAIKDGAHPRKFGSLDQHRRSKALIRRKPEKLQIHNLEIHVTHACNLACKACSHFSNENVGTNVSLASLTEQMSFWSHRIAPKQFSILGGEPALNPELTEIVRECRNQWPDSRLVLVSNGFRLFKHPLLPQALEETGCELHVSIHHKGSEYTQKVEAVRELLNEWQNEFAFKLEYRSSSENWRMTFEGEGAEIRPRDDNDAEASWKICPSKYCPQIFEGKLWKCPQVAYLRLMNRKHQLSDEWSEYLDYQPLEPYCSTNELKEFLNRKVESICKMCPAENYFFELPSPFK